MIFWPNPLSIIVFVMYTFIGLGSSTQTIHKQTTHEQTGLNLDELIWDELDLVLIHTCPHHPRCGEQKSTKFETNWFGQIGLKFLLVLIPVSQSHCDDLTS